MALAKKTLKSAFLLADNMLSQSHGSYPHR